MEDEGLTSAKFSDILDINRAVISHILNGRNNPSLDVVTKILSTMDYINPEWLLTGTGDMYKDNVNKELLAKERDLFHQEAPKPFTNKEEHENYKETNIKYPEKESKDTTNQNDMVSGTNNKKITQIIIYYDDNTFETFSPYRV